MFLPKITFCGLKKSDSRQFTQLREEGFTFHVLHLLPSILSFFGDECGSGEGFYCGLLGFVGFFTSPSISLSKKKKASVGFTRNDTK